MPSNAFMPSELDVVNDVLSELAILPVDNILDDKQAILITLKLKTLFPELLMRTPWNWAIKYVTLNTPITNPISPEFTYNFQLPFDYGRIFRFYQTPYWNGTSSGLNGTPYAIVDNILMTNISPINLYYIVNSVDYDVITPLFFRALVLYTASVVCLPLTKNLELTKHIEARYQMKLVDAILQNDMERAIVETPYNEFDRVTFV